MHKIFKWKAQLFAKSQHKPDIEGLSIITRKFRQCDKSDIELGKCPKPDEDCICPYDGPMKSYQIVKEIVCEPCPYRTWKPKVPSLEQLHAETKKKVVTRELKKCFPGMKKKSDMTNCEKQQLAKECWARIDPMNVHNPDPCPEEKKKDEGDGKKEKKEEKPKCPEADWEFPPV